MTLLLKLPHSPRSPVMTMSITLPPASFVSRMSSSGCVVCSTRVARLLRTRSIWFANGRAPTTRSCDRRSFDAETIFMALVICWIDLTARIRRRISMRDGMCPLVLGYAPTAAGSAANCSPNSLIAAFSSPFSASSSCFFSVSAVSTPGLRVSRNR